MTRDPDDIDFRPGHSVRDLIAAVIEVQPILNRPALLGGLAMRFYGSKRITEDVDFAALTLRGAPEGEALTIGGVRFLASNGVEVDVIVREDDYSALYIAGAANARVLRVEGADIRTVTPEYLAVMKIVAGREDKDIPDLKFLLTRPGFQFDEAVELAYAYIGNYGAQELRQYDRIARWEKDEREKEIKKP
jgi:hypothetical protein